MFSQVSPMWNSRLSPQTNLSSTVKANTRLMEYKMATSWKHKVKSTCSDGCKSTLHAGMQSTHSVTPCIVDTSLLRTVPTVQATYRCVVQNYP